MFFNTANGNEFINNFTNGQDFIWLAEYVDGSIYTEFDFNNNQENNFYSINKEMLSKFGLIGCGYKFYYNIESGSFILNDRKIDMEFESNNKIHKLTNSNNKYTDIIQYKDAESIINPLVGKGQLENNIIQYNFGYKIKLNFDDFEINLKIICHIPLDKPIYLEIRLVSNKNLNGKLVLKKNNEIIDSYDINLISNVGGLLNWDVI